MQGYRTELWRCGIYHMNADTPPNPHRAVQALIRRRGADTEALSLVLASTREITEEINREKYRGEA